MGARALLVELKALYFGNNNGSLFLSVREAAKRVRIGKTLAAECLLDLCARGFIRVARRGEYTMKMASRRGDATAWILTEYPIGDAKGAGTRDFMKWKPPPDSERQRSKNHLTVRVEGRAVPLGGHSPRNGAELSSHTDTLGTKPPSDGPPGGTQIVYQGKGCSR